MQRFSERLAVVTGAGRGIGKAVALRLAREGAALVVSDIDLGAAKSVSEEITADGGTALSVTIDVTAPEQIDQIPDVCATEFGRLPDVVVCNAGIQQVRDVFDVSADEWDRVFAVNGRGCLLTLRMAARAMRRLDRGAIVTVASIQGRLGNRYYPHYAASKAAVINLTKSFAVALAAYNVRVNAVAPGVIGTELWAKVDEELAALLGAAAGEPKRERIARVPLGRAGTPDDVAAAVAFLASDDASYITGECLHVCGGDLMI